MFLFSSFSCLCPIHWSQVLSREWRCSWSSADRWCSNYIWMINNFIAYEGVAYIWGLRVIKQECAAAQGERYPLHPQTGIEMVLDLKPMTLKISQHWAQSHYRYVCQIWKQSNQSILSYTVSHSHHSYGRLRGLPYETIISSFMDSLCRVRNKVIYVLLWWTVYAPTRVLLWCLFSSLLCHLGTNH